MDFQLDRKVKPVEVWPRMTVNELILQMKGAGVFTGGNLAKAVDIYEQMVNEGVYIFLTLAGALTPAGMRKIILTLIRRKLVNAIVSTGANLVHDTMEALGGSFYQGSPYLDDSKLADAEIDRIYDILVTEKDFREKFDNPLLAIYEDIDRSLNGRLISINELLTEIAKRLPTSDCIIKACYENDVKLFSPTIADSVFGLQMAIYNRLHKGNLRVDAFQDLQEMWDIREAHDKVGAIVLGGGVPKNYVFQSFFFSKKKLNYVIQITLDRPETGGLSGAPPEEAVSWGKVRPDANKVVVVSEVTVAFPIIVAALLERLDKK
ncbi:MAG: deoxyhypusine synthase family protein [Nitrososphaerales archaeon]